MRKILFAIALLSVALTSCLEDEQQEKELTATVNIQFFYANGAVAPHRPICISNIEPEVFRSSVSHHYATDTLYTNADGFLRLVLTDKDFIHYPTNNTVYVYSTVYSQLCDMEKIVLEAEQEINIELHWPKALWVPAY